MKYFLYGPSGSGKSTLGKLLAERWNLTWIDLDQKIEQDANQSIESIFQQRGEASFRELESTLLRRLLNTDQSMVVSLGGGALLAEVNRQAALREGQVLVLSAQPDTLLARLSADQNQRPLLQGDARQRLTDLLARRGDHYRSFGDPVVTDGLPPEAFLRELQVRFGRFRVTGMGNPYDALIGKGTFDRLGALLNERNLNGSAVVVCDANVEPLYSHQILTLLADAGIGVSKIILPAGEVHKTFQTVSSLWESFVMFGLDRKGMVVALGGGVIGDLAGFAAATYMRGVPWINLPTTLLSMVDSSLGGKTGADLPQGKNLIGAFHAPSLVLSDPAVLQTLPAAELQNGMAETIKHGVVADPQLFRQCKNTLQSGVSEIAGLISRAVAVKVEVIEADPLEKGRRQALNFGHTVGHGIEKASGYALAHGAAVAIGMVVETRLAESLGICAKGLADEIAGTLSSCQLPVVVPSSISREDIFSAMQFDKKRSAGQIHFALPEAIGSVHTGVVVEDWQKRIEF